MQSPIPFDGVESDLLSLLNLLPYPIKVIPSDILEKSICLEGIHTHLDPADTAIPSELEQSL